MPRRQAGGAPALLVVDDEEDGEGALENWCSTWLVFCLSSIWQVWQAVELGIDTRASPVRGA